MNITHKSACTLAGVLVAMLLYAATPVVAQVSPAEILNPRLKALEQTYLTQLLAMNRAISKMTFPFNLSLNRYAGLDPKEQLGADTRGLEFVKFHDRLVLKLTANYNAAYNADLLTQNQRANHVYDEVVVPILGLLPNYVSSGKDFDGFGLEIAYHVLRRAHGYEYEGKEILVVVLDSADALAYFDAKQDSKRQEVLNRSEIYLDGKPFGLALGTRDPFTVDALERSVRKQPTHSEQTMASTSTSTDEDVRTVRAIENRIPLFHTSSADMSKSAARPEAPVAAAAAALTQAEVEGIQRKYQSQLDALKKEGSAKLHFVDYAPPSFVVFRNQLLLQLSLRNPQSFDKDSTSIYKRAAQSFDLFLAPQLKAILERVPDGAEFGGLDITIVNELASKSTHSSEALEFICTLKALRQFAAAEITNQDLINKSIVLVNGVRIAVNLQLVE